MAPVEVGPQFRVAAGQVVVVDASAPAVAEGPQLGGVDGGLHDDLGDAGFQVHGLSLQDGGLGQRSQAVMVDGEDPLLGGQGAERESGPRLGVAALEPDGQAVLDGEVQQHVEELRPVLEGPEVGGEVADVEAPEHGPFQLGPALGTGLVQVGMVPEVADRAGEAAVAVQQ